ncbi:M67 family metallopeptidase [Deinococcus sonorensis]|uniref:M67 family metallopeptidase n=2 Tax=Deinococcus sonorensis TaxID=309891 RepID=A0AAU7U9I1_9DEIO
MEAALWQHVNQALPQEAVGVLGGRAGVIQAVYPLPNRAQDPLRTYLADPGALVRVLKAMQADGQDWLAIYHSHPQGPAWPSRTDLERATYRLPYLIADARRGELRAFLLPGGQEVELQRSGLPGQHAQHPAS